MSKKLTRKTEAKFARILFDAVMDAAENQDDMIYELMDPEYEYGDEELCNRLGVDAIREVISLGFKAKYGEDWITAPAEKRVVVCDNPFEALDTNRRDFFETVIRELLNGVTCDYAGKIADAIAEDVADDVVECADPNAWNDCDVRLAIGRVLLKTLGVSV